MLTRKPRIGEVLHYSPPAAYGPGMRAHTFTVIGFDDRFPSICKVRDESGRGDQFIWQFHDGLNRFMSHADAGEEVGRG